MGDDAAVRSGRAADGAAPVRADASITPRRILTEAQIAAFIRDGYVVVPGVLSKERLAAARRGLAATLQRHGVSMEDAATHEGLRRLSTTRGAGGVLDLFYDRWKLDLTLATPAYADATATSSRCDAASCNVSRRVVGLAPSPRRHAPSRTQTKLSRAGDLRDERGPLGPPLRPRRRRGALGPRRRVGVPRARRGGQEAGAPAIADDLDCCPDRPHAGGSKRFPRWSTIQCFLALDDALEADQGEPEMRCGGFHRRFEA